MKVYLLTSGCFVMQDECVVYHHGDLADSVSLIGIISSIKPHEVYNVGSVSNAQVTRNCKILSTLYHSNYSFVLFVICSYQSFVFRYRSSLQSTCRELTVWGLFAFYKLSGPALSIISHASIRLAPLNCLAKLRSRPRMNTHPSTRGHPTASRNNFLTGQL